MTDLNKVNERRKQTDRRVNREDRRKTPRSNASQRRVQTDRRLTTA